MIDPERLSIVEKEKQTYIQYQLSPQEQVSKIELEMLKNNRIPSVLGIAESQDDEKHILFYNVTGKYQLAQCFTNVFNGQKLYNMLKSLCRIWQQADEYMLDISHFILYPEFLCLDMDTSELYAMVLPLEGDTGQAWDFGYILHGIFENLLYQDPSMQTFADDIYSYIAQMHQVHRKEFEEFLEKTYRAAKGILKPVSNTPQQPEETAGAGREILHEEEAKEVLKRRFEVQNEEIRNLYEPVQNITGISGGSYRKKGKDTGSTGKGFAIPGVNGKSKTIPVITEKPKKEKLKEEKIKPEKIKKEKLKKDKELIIPNTEINKQDEEEKKEMKEKKGFFSGLFGKKKGQKEEKADVLTPPSLKPIDPINEEPVDQNENVENEWGSQNGWRNQNRPDAENRVVPRQPDSYPVWSFSGTGNNQKQTDLNATVPDTLKIDLNATIADDQPVRNKIVLPALRSRNTGEVIKITGNGFLVGRQRMENGKPVITKGEKQPDLAIQQGNISRSHAKFVYQDQKWYIEDLDSLNGTYVNNEKIKGMMIEALQEGDQIRFATTDPVEYEFLLSN